MTAQQLILMISFYLALVVAVAYFTRATWQRIVGALTAAAAVGLLTIGLIALGEAMRLWEVPALWTLQVLVLLYLALTVSCIPIYLLSWRVARRFGLLGLMVLVGTAAVVGPLRDYSVAVKYPEWIVFAPGVAPMLAVGTIYGLLVGGGHALMRMIAGRSKEDRLASRRWDAA